MMYDLRSDEVAEEGRREREAIDATGGENRGRETGGEKPGEI